MPAAVAAPPDNDNAKDNNDDDDDDDDHNNVDLPHDNNDVDLPREERLVIDKVGIALGDRGCKCREHNVCCGEVLDVDIVARLCHKEILVPDGKANMRKETAITVNWATNGFERCHVGFLPLPYVPDAARYDGALCQVIEVFDIVHLLTYPDLLAQIGLSGTIKMGSRVWW